MRRQFLLAVVTLAIARGSWPQALADPVTLFRSGNEKATQQKWDDAIAAYDQARQAGARSPALYWNWAQAALSRGHRGEALWALLRARSLDARDATIEQQIVRLSGALALDSAETNTGPRALLGRVVSKFHLDVTGVALTLVAAALAFGPKARNAGRGILALATVLVLMSVVGAFPERRAVVIHAEAPLFDIPRNDGLALANLREGEVVPVLSEQGDFVQIQDASGARGYAHREDVRDIDPRNDLPKAP